MPHADLFDLRLVDRQTGGALFAAAEYCYGGGTISGGADMNSKLVRVIGALGVLWNAGGVFAYLDHVGATGGEPGTALPALITAAFATSAFAGLAGSLGHALLQRWAAPVLWLSFAAAVVTWGWVFAYGREGEVPLGVAVIVGALLLAVVASRATRARAVSTD